MTKLSTALALILALGVPSVMAQTTTTGTTVDAGASSDGSATTTDGSAAASGDASAGASTDTTTDAGTGTTTDAGAGTTTDAGAGTNTTTNADGSTTAGANAGGNAAAGASASASVEISTEQQTEIRTVVTEVDVQPVVAADIDFDLSVGVAVPSTIVLKPLPVRIVEIVPQYEGFLFFRLDDGRIIIVDPNSLQIVLIISA